MRALPVLSLLIILSPGCASFDQRRPVDFVARWSPGKPRVRIPYRRPRVGDLRTVKTCFSHGAKPWRCVVILERVAEVRGGHERALCIRVIRSDFKRHRHDVGVTRLLRRVGQDKLRVYSTNGARVRRYTFGSRYRSLGHDNWPYRALAGLRFDAGHFAGFKTVAGVRHAEFRYLRHRKERPDYRTTVTAKDTGSVRIRLSDGLVSSVAVSHNSLVLGEHSSRSLAHHSLTIRSLNAVPAALGSLPRCQLPW